MALQPYTPGVKTQTATFSDLQKRMAQLHTQEVVERRGGTWTAPGMIRLPIVGVVPTMTALLGAAIVVAIVVMIRR